MLITPPSSFFAITDPKSVISDQPSYNRHGSPSLTVNNLYPG